MPQNSGSGAQFCFWPHFAFIWISEGSVRLVKYLWVFYAFPLRVIPQPLISELTLVGGSGSHEGNIFVGGLPVCDDFHDHENAIVVCRWPEWLFSIKKALKKSNFQDAWVFLCTTHYTFLLWLRPFHFFDGRCAVFWQWGLNSWLSSSNGRQLWTWWRGWSHLLTSRWQKSQYLWKCSKISKRVKLSVNCTQPSRRIVLLVRLLQYFCTI